MSAALRLARPEDLDRLMGLVTAFHSETDIAQDMDQTRTALAPLLEGIPHGCVYLIGPGRAPLGYIVLTFGWSVEFGGMDAFVDEIYIRPAVRGRGHRHRSSVGPAQGTGRGWPDRPSSGSRSHQ